MKKKFAFYVLFNIIMMYNTLLSQVKSDTIVQSPLNSVIDTNRNQSSSDSSKITVHFVPYCFYSNLLEWAFGGFLGINGLLHENTITKAGAYISTNSSILGYLQMEDFQLPFYPRIFLKPDLLGGKIGIVQNYSAQPGTKTYGTNAGQNESDKDNYFETDGIYQWYEMTLKYLLPIGWAKDSCIAAPKLKNGILQSGATGGYDLNPLVSGRTFVGVRVFYNSLKMEKNSTEIVGIGSGFDFTLNVENLDYFWNPTRGYNFSLSYIIDSKALNSSSSFKIIKSDLALYIPLSPVESLSPDVLAFDVQSCHTPTWDDYDIETINNINISKYHRPENFIGAALGGHSRMRGYAEYRYFDCSSIYYCAEYRKILPWNPFNGWWLTKKIGVDWIQLAAFGELGRVAPYWRLSTLHEDMKWDIGLGARFFMGGVLIRLDVAAGKEGTMVQMFYNYSF